jgi:Tfp pilus assembly protein PilN
VQQLNLPWRDLAAALADATPASIALLALEPDAKRRTLRISAEAKNSDDMLAYITRLQAEEWFTSVVLMRHEVMQEDPNRPLRFQVSVQWGTP